MSQGPAPQNYPGGPPARGGGPGRAIAIIAGVLVVVIILLGGGTFLAVRGGAFDQAGKDLRANFDAGFAKSFFPSMHDGCVKSASARSAELGSDKIETYCSCVVEAARAKLSVADLEGLTFNPNAEPGISTIRAMADSCRAKLGP